VAVVGACLRLTLGILRAAAAHHGIAYRLERCAVRILCTHHALPRIVVADAGTCVGQTFRGIRAAFAIPGGGAANRSSRQTTFSCTSLCDALMIHTAQPRAATHIRIQSGSATIRRRTATCIWIRFRTRPNSAECAEKEHAPTGPPPESAALRCASLRRNLFKFLKPAHPFHGAKAYSTARVDCHALVIGIALEKLCPAANARK
jgi:hypothetical protein